MKRSVNLRRKPRSASAKDLLATFRRLGMSDDEIKAELLKMKSAQHGVQRTGGEYPLEIDDRAELVVVKQYDAAGEEVSISNILPPSTTSR